MYIHISASEDVPHTAERMGFLLLASESGQGRQAHSKKPHGTRFASKGKNKTT